MLLLVLLACVLSGSQVFKVHELPFEAYSKVCVLLRFVLFTCNA